MTSDFLFWWRQPPRNDASTIMGMQTPVAAALAIGIWVVSVVLGIAAGGVLSPLLYIASMAVMFSALAVLLSAPRDPLVGWATAYIVVAPPVAMVMAIPALTSRPGMAYGTLTGVSVIVLAFLAVRGRPVAAWTGYGLGLGAALLADHFAGPLPALLAAQAPNLAVVLMATIFAAIVRLRARQIYAFRGETERETALRYAEEATLAVRDQQLSRLDERARPLLDRIASGRRLGAEDLRLCRLVEAQLRDRIRAPGFDSPAVAGAAWRARARGARVVMLDDLGRDSQVPPRDALDAVSAELVELLDALQEGDEVTARLLPAGRNSFATVSFTNDKGFDRREFDDRGMRKDLGNRR